MLLDTESDLAVGVDKRRSIVHWGPCGTDTKESEGRKKEVSNESLNGSGSASERNDGEGRRILDS